ncbi:MAG: alpha/beta hydrolase, partial [Bacteroidota bacterium]
MKTIKQMIKIILVIYLLGLLGLYFLQEKLLFFPTQLPKDYRFEFPNAFEEVNLKVEEGIELNMLLFKAVASKGVVLFF